MNSVVDLVGLASSRTVFLELVDAIEAGKQRNVDTSIELHSWKITFNKADRKGHRVADWKARSPDGALFRSMIGLKQRFGDDIAAAEAGREPRVRTGSKHSIISIEDMSFGLTFLFGELSDDRNSRNVRKSMNLQEATAMPSSLVDLSYSSLVASFTKCWSMGVCLPMAAPMPRMSASGASTSRQPRALESSRTPSPRKYSASFSQLPKF